MTPRTPSSPTSINDGKGTKSYIHRGGNATVVAANTIPHNGHGSGSLVVAAGTVRSNNEDVNQV